jgi:hypothetical protein
MVLLLQHVPVLLALLLVLPSTTAVHTPIVLHVLNYCLHPYVNKQCLCNL